MIYKVKNSNTRVEEADVLVNLFKTIVLGNRTVQIFSPNLTMPVSKEVASTRESLANNMTEEASKVSTSTTKLTAF
jgi:hypothetical protein